MPVDRGPRETDPTKSSDQQSAALPNLPGCRSGKEADFAYLQYGPAGPVAVSVKLLLALGRAEFLQLASL